MAQLVKNPPAMQEMPETQIQCLDRDDLLEEKNGNPLQYSCQENPMERSLQIAIHGTAESGHD